MADKPEDTPEKPQQKSISATWDHDTPMTLDSRWIECLAYTPRTAMEGLAAWVSVCPEHVLVDTTEEVARAWGLPVAEIMGKRMADLDADVTNLTTAEVVRERIDEICKNGGSTTTVDVVKLADRGWTSVIATHVRLQHPEDDVPDFIMHIAHDVTDAVERLAFMRAPGFQNSLILLIESDGKCLMATDAAARLCGKEKGEELINFELSQTPFKKLAAQEEKHVRQSRLTGHPSSSVEMLALGNGDVGVFAVERTSYPGGRWTVQLIPIPLAPVFFQLPVRDMLKAKNMHVGQPPKPVSFKKFETLVDMANGLKLEEAAAYRGTTKGNVSKHRTEIKERLGVSKPKKIIAALAGTPIGLFVNLWAMKEREIMDAKDLGPEL